jgi:IS605 OrfB family transposase
MKIVKEQIGVAKNIKTKDVRCKQVELRPKLRERHILKTWFELYRQTYNLTIALLKNHSTLSKYDARNKIKDEIRKNTYMTSLIYKTKIPVHTLDNAVFDVFKAKKAAISNLKAGNIKFFRLRYKKQSHHLKTLVLESSVFNSTGLGLKNKVLKNLYPSSPIRTTKDSRLRYNTRTGKITLFIPYEKEVSKSLFREKVCTLDPGLRTFQTIYAPSGIVYQIGDEKNIIKKNLDRIELVKKFKDQPWYCKYTNRLREKLKNRIADLHWKTSSFLCKNFDTILVGNMSTTGIVKNGSSVLGDSTKRMAYALSHFLFKERLKSKASELSVNFKVVDESYTSKTCGRCGEINSGLGSSKLFECPNSRCFYRMHRDINGARNIYIKNYPNCI